MRPYLWIKIGKWHLGIIPDNGCPPLFSERYGYRRVRRFLGYKLMWSRFTAHCLRFHIGWAERR